MSPAELLRKLAAKEPLAGADLKGIALSAADLRGARFDGARLDEADLSSANLSGASLEKCSLRRLKASGANLQGSSLRGADLTGADLVGASLRGANLHGAFLNDADLSGASLEEADLRFCKLTGTKTEGTRFDGALYDRMTRFDPGKVRFFDVMRQEGAAGPFLAKPATAPAGGPPYAVGQRVRYAKGAFLHQGIFILPTTVITVEKVVEKPEGRRYDIRFLDKESQPHLIEGVAEADLRPV